MKCYFIILLQVLFAFSVFAQTDSICSVRSIPNTCIETSDGDTVFLSNDMILFGDSIGFCPQRMPSQTRDSIQVVLCFDQSGSMSTTDPGRAAIMAAETLAQRISDRSPTSKWGMNFFGDAGGGGAAVGYFPVTLTPTSLVSVIARIALANSYPGQGTPYGSSLDTALNYFNAMKTQYPAMPDSNKYVVFMSDGDPNGTSYTNFLAARRDTLLPRVYSIYFHAAFSQTAEDTLRNLATRTHGRYFNASNVTQLYAAFDTILQKIIPKTTVKNFYMTNLTTDQCVMAKKSDTSANPYISFPPIFVESGVNTVQFWYQQSDSGSLDTTKCISKTVYLYRKHTPLTPSQKVQFDSLFQTTCFERSHLTFADSNYNLMAINTVYNSSFKNVLVTGTRGPETPAQENDKLVIRTQSGDVETLMVVETNPTSNIYHGSMSISLGAVVQRNGIVNIKAIDTLYLSYYNTEFSTIVNGAKFYFDTCFDTIAVHYTGPAKSLILYSQSGDPASLTSYSDTTSPVVFQPGVTPPLNFYAKVFDQYTNYWLGDRTTNQDTAKVTWTLLGFNNDSLSYKHNFPFNIFSPHYPDTGFVIVSKDMGGGILIGDLVKIIVIPSTVIGDGIKTPKLIVLPKVFDYNSVILSDKSVNFNVSMEKSGSFELKIYDIRGKQIWSFLKQNVSTGFWPVQWKNENFVPNGICLVRLKRSNKQIVRKLMLIPH